MGNKEIIILFLEQQRITIIIWTRYNKYINMYDGPTKRIPNIMQTLNKTNV